MADKQRKDDSTCTVQGVGVGVGSYSSYESGVGSSGHEGGVGFRHESAVPSQGAGSSSGGGKRKADQVPSGSPVKKQKRGDHVKVVVRVKSSSVESDVDLSGFEVLDRSASQEDCYAQCKPLIEGCLAHPGQAGTVFTYGPSGSGKSFTLLRPDGVLARAVAQVLEDKRVDEVQMSAFEIYKNQLYDLLADRDIRSGKDPSIKSGKRAKSDGISNVATAMMKIKAAELRRKKRVTALNNLSSRSHLFYTLKVSFKEHTKVSELRFVDLAGLEKEGEAAPATASMADREAFLYESRDINKSLGFFSLMLRRPDEVHMDHFLNKELKGKVGGNNQTIMFLCIHGTKETKPIDERVVEFGNMVRKIKQEGLKVQEVAAPMSNLQILHKENEELRSHLEERDREIARMKKIIDDMLAKCSCHQTCQDQGQSSKQTDVVTTDVEMAESVEADTPVLNDVAQQPTIMPPMPVAQPQWQSVAQLPVAQTLPVTPTPTVVHPPAPAGRRPPHRCQVCRTQLTNAKYAQLVAEGRMQPEEPHPPAPEPRRHKGRSDVAPMAAETEQEKRNLRTLVLRTKRIIKPV